MNPKIASLLILAAAALATPVARADVYCTANSSMGNDGAEVSYTTGGGLVAVQSGNGGYGYAPDTAPGHQAFSLQTSVSNTDLFSSASADNTTGTLRALAAGSSGHSANRAQIFDNITFQNTTGQPQAIMIIWNVEGSLAVSNEQTGRAGYHADLRMEGPGVILRFLSDATLESNAESSSTSHSESGWDSYSCQPRSGGYGGFDCSGTWTVPAGGFTLSFYALIDTVINVSAGVGPFSANFGNTGHFGITVPPGVSFTSNGGALSGGSRMVNIATRADVLGGDNVAIGGFIITGNVPKKVIIRGIGPSLKAFGVPTAMDDPTLELKELAGNTTLATNDNWKDTQEAEIQNSGLAPGNTLESAIIRTLSPGNYSATLRGKNDGKGIGLVEVYDLDAAADAKLANISTRAFVEAGNNVLIGGIIGGGNGSQPKVLIRAIGPSLTPFGVPNALQDPVLELHDKNGATITTNDDWQSSADKDAIEATGLAPTNPKESAILATLEPTNYTAIVKGANNTAGVGLVEVYHLQ